MPAKHRHLTFPKPWTSGERIMVWFEDDFPLDKRKPGLERIVNARQRGAMRIDVPLGLHVSLWAGDGWGLVSEEPGPGRPHKLPINGARPEAYQQLLADLTTEKEMEKIVPDRRAGRHNFDVLKHFAEGYLGRDTAKNDMQSLRRLYKNQSPSVIARTLFGWKYGMTDETVRALLKDRHGRPRPADAVFFP